MNNYDELIAKELEEERKRNLEVQKDIIRRQELMSIEIDKLKDVQSDSSMLIMEYHQKLFVSITFLITLITIACAFIPNPIISTIVWTIASLLGTVLTMKEIGSRVFDFDTNYLYHRKNVSYCEFGIKDYEAKIKALDSKLNEKRQEVVNILEAIKGNNKKENIKIQELKNTQRVLNNQETIEYLKEEKNRILGINDLEQYSNHVKQKYFEKK